MHASPLNNTALANLYADITQACAKFQQIDITKLNDPFKGSSNWRPLLIEEKEMEEVGQRIFLHAIRVDIQRLKVELAENKDLYADKDANSLKKQTELEEAQKNQAHELGVERIKKSQTRIPAINSLSSSLHHYLYSPETFNKEDKKMQVPIKFIHSFCVKSCG